MSSMDLNSFGSISSWCIGLKAGPAGLPALVRAGAPGWSPIFSGETTPLSAFAMCIACPPRSNYRFLLRGPAPRGYNGDGRCCELVAVLLGVQGELRITRGP